MREILLLLTLFPFKPDTHSNPPSWNKILSKHYSLAFSAESSRFLAFDSVGKLTILKGFIDRNENHLVSKSDSDIGILEDSTCFYMNAAQRMMTVGTKSSVGAFLIQPLCDPYEVINYAITSKMGFQQYAEEGKLIYDFVSLRHDDLIFNISMSFYDDHADSFSIKFIYQQSPFLKQDIVRYKFVTQPVEKPSERIADFLDVKNGKFEPKATFKKYFFVNTFLFQRKK